MEIYVYFIIEDPTSLWLYFSILSPGSTIESSSGRFRISQNSSADKFILCILTSVWNIPSMKGRFEKNILDRDGYTFFEGIQRNVDRLISSKVLKNSHFLKSYRSKVWINSRYRLEKSWKYLISCCLLVKKSENGLVEKFIFLGSMIILKRTISHSHDYKYAMKKGNEEYLFIMLHMII